MIQQHSERLCFSLSAAAQVSTPFHLHCWNKAGVSVHRCTSSAELSVEEGQSPRHAVCHPAAGGPVHGVDRQVARQTALRDTRDRSWVDGTILRFVV